METIIQAGNKRLRIASVPITTNPKTRESRLFKNIWQHMFKSGLAIIRSFLMFKPYVILGWLGALMLLAGIIPFVRFFIFFLQGTGGGHVQSLIFGSSMIVGGLLCLALLVIADLLRTNRVLLEDSLERLKEIQFGVRPHLAETEEEAKRARLAGREEPAAGGDAKSGPDEAAGA